MAIVTSRDSLSGLVARDGARRLDLDLLPLDEAIGLLRTLIGGRVDGDLDAAAALAAQCSRLPLALRVAADFAVTRPAVPLADLVTELAIQHRTLDLLDAGGDSRTGVRAVFSWSYRHLDPGTALAFRLMALHPGPDVDPFAAAALTNTTVEQAKCYLELLARAHLLTATELGRYVMHDLLRVYALDLACTCNTEDQRGAALTRLFDYYLHTAAVAMDTLFTAERHLQPGMGSPDAPAPPVSAPDTARRWLDAERTSLVAVAAHSAAHGWPGHATRLAAALARYLGNGCHFAEAIAIHGSARDAARLAGDHVAEAAALIRLGDISWEQDDGQQAFATFQQALAKSREAGDPAVEAGALSALGLAERSLGLYEQAAGHLRAAVTMYREVSDRLGEAQALSRLGSVFRRQGRYEPATSCYGRALAMFREAGDRGGEGYAHFRIGVAELQQGRHQQAADHFRQAVPLFCETGDRLGEAETLAELGFAELRQNSYRQAASQFQRALALFREAGVRSGEAKALGGLGEILLLTGFPGRAIAHYRAALDLAMTGDSDERARSYAGLARAHHLTGDSGQARRYWREALSVYAELGSPEADKIHAEMITAGYDDAKRAGGHDGHARPTRRMS
jgi:tetratricopeptide (TPR) repeat protein